MIDSLIYKGEICWVYLLKGNQDNSYEILFDRHLPEKIEQHNELADRLVYYRQFDKIVDGIAHRLFLKSISETSIKRLISINNPGMLDLKTELLKIKNRTHSCSSQSTSSQVGDDNILNEKTISNNFK